MNHAIFLDQPVRMNPRRQSQQSQSVSESLPSLTPQNASTTSPQSSSLSPWVLTSGFDAPLMLMSPPSHSMEMSPTTTLHSMERDHNVAEELATLSPSSRVPQKSFASAESKPSRIAQRRTTKAACSACHKRKAKCDGKRPTCSSCIAKKRRCEYLAEEGVSSQAASRKRLEGYATVLNLIREASAEDCKNILDDLRGTTSMDKGVNTVLEKWQHFKSGRNETR
ncbi:hypothetical protein E4T47_04694 [Aureobasidium subglaciale]|nr:hypothetical protein E4T47_04694 [Aureobasidium subglaciale]